MSCSGPPVLPPVAVAAPLGRVAVTPFVPRSTMSIPACWIGGVGEGVRAGVAEDLVVAESGDDRVVARRRRGCTVGCAGRGAAAADEAVVAVAAVHEPAVAAHQGVVAPAAEDRVVARRSVDDPAARAHRGGPHDRVDPVAADEEVVAVGADQGPDVVVDDVALLAADGPARGGRPRLGKPDEDAGGAIDDVQSAQADGDVGEGVGPGAAGHVVAAGPRSERVVAVAAVDGGDVGEAAAADDRVVAVPAVHRAAVSRDQRVVAAPAVDGVRALRARGLGIDAGRAGRRGAGDRVRPRRCRSGCRRRCRR